MRGEINNRKKAQQIRDFSGLRFGTITPTDIDGVIEYKSSGYVIIETKTGNTPLPKGQYKALVRMCDDLGDKKPTLLIIARHETPVEKDIDVALCKVDSYRYKQAWHNAETTVRALIDKFLLKLEMA